MTEFNFFNMLDAMVNDCNNYDNRKVANKEQVGQFKVSSCYTSDMGYETAICYADEVYPVERYNTREECIEGHKKWIEWAKNAPKQIPYLQFDNETIELIEVEE